jgi:hypothetical protein
MCVTENRKMFLKLKSITRRRHGLQRSQGKESLTVEAESGISEAELLAHYFPHGNHVGQFLCAFLIATDFVGVHASEVDLASLVRVTRSQYACLSELCLQLVEDGKGILNPW